MADFCDFTQLRMRWRPNWHLILPPGFDSPVKPHETSPAFAEAPDALFRRLKAVIAEEPRVEWLAEDCAGFRLELVQRSRIFRFPDKSHVS